MGESSRLETAITVTGLKPCHFYNVRVIAVGSNNFQAGSGVIRLKTYGRDGIPSLANGRVPSNFIREDLQNGTLADSSDDSPSARSHGVGIEAAALPEGMNIMARESGSGVSGQRRNTGGRRHSPSNAAAEQAAQARALAQEPAESMQELTEKFEAIRRETEEIASQIVKDSEEFKLQIHELTMERDEKRQTLKEKEEASEKLKKELRDSERLNRQAQTRKSQKEKTLRDKQAERTRMQDDLVRWRNEIDAMKKEREKWQAQKEEAIKEKEAKVDDLRGTILQRQNSLGGLEEDIRVKGRQIEELKTARETPGVQDDEESRERDAAEKQRDFDWDMRERELRAKLSQDTVTLRFIKQELDNYQNLYQSLASQAMNPFMYHHGNSSGVDFDPTGGQGTAKPRRSRNRKSRTNTVSSPIASFPITDSSYPSVSAYNNLNNTISPTFAQGPYFDLSNDTAMVPLSEQMSGMSEADIRALTAGAPLSPTATNLLPAELFNDDDPPSPGAGSTRSFGQALYGNIGSAALLENDPQSPVSSSRSPSLVSSPQDSSHNLAKYGVSSHDYSVDIDRHSLNSPRTAFGAIGSPSGSDQAASHKSFGKNLFTFPRARGKTMQEDGPALGSLKQGQSQSFPRSTEEPEANRHRRISFSTSWNMPSFLTRSSAVGDATEGNGPAPARNVGARRRRGFNMFGSNGDEPSGVYPDRDPSSPRPLSIASSDLPRPSTDSAPFGWPAALDGSTINRNSPLATNWSIHVAPTNRSRNPSRRPSLQHGSTTALTGGIASDDDEFLPSESLAGQSSPPPVGVIGTRPPSSHKPVTPKLNPAAPTFKLFNRTKGKEKAVEPSISSQAPQNTSATSPTESRKSRDTPSIHTQNSSMAESHESLERTESSTPSEMTNPSAASTKDKESSFQKLLRKGSSSKFSLSSIRNKDSGFFGGKKGPASATNSERADRDGSFDGFGEDAGLGRSVDSVTSSPMIGSLGSGEWKGKENQAGTPKEGRMSVNWGRAFGIKKDKNKGGEGLDVESRSEAETTGTEDEG